MDSTTKESNKFTLSNYNGGVNITDLPKGYEVIGASKGQKVTQVESGKEYRVKYIGNGNPSSNKANQVVGNIQAKANYESLKDSNYFSATTNNPRPSFVSGEINKWQNMVNLETENNSFYFPII